MNIKKFLIIFLIGLSLNFYLVNAEEVKEEIKIGETTIKDNSKTKDIIVEEEKKIHQSTSIRIEEGNLGNTLNISHSIFTDKYVFDINSYINEDGEKTVSVGITINW